MPLDPTQMIVPATDAVKSKAVTDTLSDAWNLVVGDRFAAFRLTNAAKIQIKLQKRFDELGVKPDNAKIPDRFAVTWFEEATKQDDPEIQDLFTDLLANAALDNEDALDRTHIDTVSKMTPSDAKVFKLLTASEYIDQPRFIKNGLRRNSLITIIDNNIQVDASRAIDHLIGFGILRMRNGIDTSNMDATIRRIANATNDLAGERKIRLPIGTGRGFAVRPAGAMAVVLDLICLTNQGISLHRALTQT